MHLTIIGKPRAGASADLIESLGLRDCISYVSGVSDERIVELYAESTLAVVPSLYEGFSLPSVEAMATGICLVATTGGALPEVTGRDGDTVLSCPPGDAGALAAAIRRGLDDEQLRAKVGAAGRQRVVERWSWRYCASLTVDQYREVLAMPHNVEKLRRRIANENA
jgi:glycosyltransferase involved in cell wall biosynthesis